MPLRTVNDELLSRLVRHHVDLQRLGNSLADQALARLNDSDAEIYDVIERHLPRSGVEKLLATVANINARTYTDIGIELGDELKQLARYEVEHHCNMIETVLPMPWDVMRPKQKFLHAIVYEEPFRGGLLSEWIEGMAEGRFARVRQQIRIGDMAREEPDQIIRRIKGTRSLGFKDGAGNISRRSLQQMIPTLTNHVANRARGTVYRDNEDIISGISWSSVLDDVTCDECASLDGEEYDVDEAIAIEESGNGPPIHPNCRCVLVPIVDDSNAFDMPLSDAQRARLDGKAPQRLTYREWLADQDAETQDGILGPERGAMFRRGMPIDKFRDHTGRRLTLAELRKKEQRELAPKAKARKQPLKVSAPRRNFGWTPDLPDQRDLLFAVEHPEDVALPVRCSMEQQMPPVFDQGNLGSCVPNALVAEMMFAFGPKTPMLSRLDLYYKARLLEDTINSDAGCEIRDGIKALARWGVCTEATWPYKIRSFRQRPSPEANAEEPLYRIRKYMRLRTHDDFMKCLASGFPFVIGFTVYENFDSDLPTRRGILPMPTVDQRVLGGHAVTIVGYDQDFHSNPDFKNSGADRSQIGPLAYLARNSYGTQWGAAGYFWFPSQYLEDRDLSDDAWTIRK